MGQVPRFGKLQCGRATADPFPAALNKIFRLLRTRGIAVCSLPRVCTEQSSPATTYNPATYVTDGPPPRTMLHFPHSATRRMLPEKERVRPSVHDSTGTKAESAFNRTGDNLVGCGGSLFRRTQVREGPVSGYSAQIKVQTLLQGERNVREQP